jgi:hypothetical protein
MLTKFFFEIIIKVVRMNLKIKLIIPHQSSK